VKGERRRVKGEKGIVFGYRQPQGIAYFPLPTSHFNKEAYKTTI
jgi:hypothetical protein